MSPSDPAREWLEEREPVAPERMLARMLTALDALPGPSFTDGVPVRLGEAALSCLRDALVKGDARAAALDLLAADALLTYGCEAAAGEGSDSLDRFVTEYGSARLDALLRAEK